MHAFSFIKIHLKMSSGKRQPFCLGLNELSAELLFGQIADLWKFWWTADLSSLNVLLIKRLTLYYLFQPFWWSMIGLSLLLTIFIHDKPSETNLWWYIKFYIVKILVNSIVLYIFSLDNLLTKQSTSCYKWKLRKINYNYIQWKSQFRYFYWIKYSGIPPTSSLEVGWNNIHCLKVCAYFDWNWSHLHQYLVNIDASILMHHLATDSYVFGQGPISLKFLELKMYIFKQFNIPCTW